MGLFRRLGETCCLNLQNDGVPTFRSDLLPESSKWRCVPTFRSDLLPESSKSWCVPTFRSDLLPESSKLWCVPTFRKNILCLSSHAFSLVDRTIILSRHNVNFVVLWPVNQDGENLKSWSFKTAHPSYWWRLHKDKDRARRSNRYPTLYLINPLARRCLATAGLPIVLCIYAFRDKNT